MEKNKRYLTFGKYVLHLRNHCGNAHTVALAFGETAKEISGMFRLGKQGIPLEVMAEFLLTSFLVTCMQYLFFRRRFLSICQETGGQYTCSCQFL